MTLELRPLPKVLVSRVGLSSQRGCAVLTLKNREDGYFNHEEAHMWKKSMRTHAFDLLPPYGFTVGVDGALHMVSPHGFLLMVEACAHKVYMIWTHGYLP